MALLDAHNPLEGKDTGDDGKDTGDDALQCAIKEINGS